MNFGTYLTYPELKQYLSDVVNAKFVNRDNTKLAQFCVQASRRLDTECRRHFYPLYATRYYDHPSTQNIDRLPRLTSRGGYRNYPHNITLSDFYAAGTSDILKLDEDLLEVVTFTTNNGNTTVAADEYFLETGDNYNYPPYSQIRMDWSDGVVFSYTGTPQRANAVSGYWGYHTQWGGAWVSLGTLAGGVLSTDTSIELNEDLEGVDENGFSPIFMPQQLLRINDEFLYSTKVDNEAQTVTVQRGVNGTTAAAHDADDIVKIFRYDPSIYEAIKVLAAYSYHRPSSVGQPSDRPVVTQSGVLLLPSQLPDDVKSIVNKLRRPSSRLRLQT